MSSFLTQSVQRHLVAEHVLGVGWLPLLLSTSSSYASSSPPSSSLPSSYHLPLSPSRFCPFFLLSPSPPPPFPTFPLFSHLPPPPKVKLIKCKISHFKVNNSLACLAPQSCASMTSEPSACVGKRHRGRAWPSPWMNCLGILPHGSG